MLHKQIISAFTCLIALSCLFTGLVSAQENFSATHLNEAPLLNLEPCEIEGVEGMLRCVTLDVFEDRTAKIGRMISLHLAILPAMSENNAHDPLFILAGGPGQSVINEARGIARDLADVRKHRDIVLVDLRGTGKSNALRCEPDTPQAKLNFLSWSLSDSLVTECLQKFNADPALYTTPILMDDLNEVRAELGYDQINLYGTSYGTRAALVYARRHPDRVRSLVLRSVAPPGVPIPLLPARHGQAALESRFAECAAEEECRTQFPSLAKNLDEVLTRLSEEPAQARYVDPASGDTSAVSINREIFAGGIQFALYTPFLAKLLPEMIHEAASNNFAPFIQVATPMAEMLPRSISLGLFYSVTCTEDAPLVWQMDDAMIASNTKKTFLGRTVLDSHARICTKWPRGSVSESFHKSVSSDVPTLLISGEMDPITPPSLAEATMRNLTNSRHIIVPGAGHSPENECVDRLISEFLQAESIQELDTVCSSE